jgi:L-glyceraldehyde 3-phosphate reductase
LHGAGAAIINPLGWGVLTDLATSGGPRHPQAGTNITRNADAYARSVARAAQFRFLARDGRTLAQAAVQFALRHPAVTMVLGGFTAVEHVEEMVGALTAPPLSTQDLARIELAWRGNLGEPGAG